MVITTQLLYSYCLNQLSIGHVSFCNGKNFKFLFPACGEQGELASGQAIKLYGRIYYMLQFENY
jgi:hypothetical protein